jgi:MFS family permease
MRMMRRRGVWTTNLAALLIGFGMYSSFVLVPQFVELPRSTGFGFSASVTGAGLFLLPSTVAMLVVSPIAGRLSTTVGSKVPLVIGALLTTLSFALLAGANSEPWEIYVGTGLMGMGIGFSFASMANLIVEAVRADETGIATGMNTIVRTIGGSLGAQVGATVVAGSVAAGSVDPTKHGFTVAFAIAAVAVGISFLASLAVPSGRRPVVATTIAS